MLYVCPFQLIFRIIPQSWYMAILQSEYATCAEREAHTNRLTKSVGLFCTCVGGLMMCGLPHLPAQHQHFRFIRRAFLAVLSLHHASTHMHSSHESSFLQAYALNHCIQLQRSTHRVTWCTHWIAPLLVVALLSQRRWRHRKREGDMCLWYRTSFRGQWHDNPRGRFLQVFTC